MAVNEALCTLLDHVCLIWERPHKYDVWADFFPSILVNDRESKGDQKQEISFANSKCSRYHKRERRLLRKELETNAIAALKASGVKLPETTPGVDEKFYKVAWYVRWIVRSPASHSRECLLDPAGHEDPFTSDFIETFGACLKEDFGASSEEVSQLADLVKGLMSRAFNFDNPKEYAWPDCLDQHFVDTVHESVSYNFYADVYAMLVLAALYGPMDYRWEFGYLNKDVMTRQTLRPLSTFAKSAERNGILKTYAMITRVTYDATSVDERDYITRTESISLKQLNEVRIGRSLPSRVIGDTAYVSLESSQLKSLRQAEVSKRHACLARSNDGWVLRDWKSTSGTLVVTRSGDRFVVGGNGNEEKSHKLANGDILCFAHNEKRAVADLPCYLFHICFEAKDA